MGIQDIASKAVRSVSRAISTNHSTIENRLKGAAQAASRRTGGKYAELRGGARQGARVLGQRDTDLAAVGAAPARSPPSLVGAARRTARGGQSARACSAQRPCPLAHRREAAGGRCGRRMVDERRGISRASRRTTDIAVRDILGERGPVADHRALPRVTFTEPEIGASGLTEQEARDSLASLQLGTADMVSTTRGQIQGVGSTGVIKLVADADRDVLVGATLMWRAGGKVLGALTLAVHARVPLAPLRSMTHAHPTFHRGIEPALKALASAVADTPGHLASQPRTSTVVGRQGLRHQVRSSPT